MQILLISDIHANYPALLAVNSYFKSTQFDAIINCGDSLVYAPFPNETLSWLQQNNVISILGNTDKKVIQLLKGKNFKKPRKHEKRVMYTWTAEHLSQKGCNYIQSLKKKKFLTFPNPVQQNKSIIKLGIFHGSPAKNHEFLFHSTPDSRFMELASLTDSDIVVCGHSHDPFHKYLGDTHFINPGSTGRMFDGNPDISCAILQLKKTGVTVQHYRISYDNTETIAAIRQASLPEIYCDMYRLGKKTN